MKNARCPVVATCTVSRDADGARCGVLATKLGCPRYFQLPFCSDESLESLLAARAPGDAWREVRAHVAALADGDARKALVLLDAALLADGPVRGRGRFHNSRSCRTVVSLARRRTAVHHIHLTTYRASKGRRVLVHVARCDAGYALIDGRRVAFDQITHVGGRLQAFVDIPKARPAQRFEAIVVVRSDGARSDAVAFGALVAYEAEDLVEEEDGAPRGRLRRHAGASDDEDEAVPESPSAKDCNVAEVSPENAAPSPRKKPRRRVVVDDDEEEDAPAADAADPLPAPDAPAAAPVPATPPVVVTQAGGPYGDRTHACQPHRPRRRPLWRPNPRPRRRRGRRRRAYDRRLRRHRARGGRGARRGAVRRRRLPLRRRRRAPRRRRRHAGRAARRRAALCYGGSAAVDRRRPRRGGAGRVDLLVAAPTPNDRPRERHRDAAMSARRAAPSATRFTPPRLGPEPALDYAPALRAIFGGEAAREATLPAAASRARGRAALGVGARVCVRRRDDATSCPPSSPFLHDYNKHRFIIATTHVTPVATLRCARSSRPRAHQARRQTLPSAPATAGGSRDGVETGTGGTPGGGGEPGPTAGDDARADDQRTAPAVVPLDGRLGLCLALDVVSEE